MGQPRISSFFCLTRLPTGLDKAKINFPVTNYCDATGQLMVDPSTASKLQASKVGCMHKGLGHLERS